MKPIYKDQILALREKGLSYRQIENQLGCSRGTIAFHLGEGQREKHAKRREKYRASEKAILQRKLKEFTRVTSNSISSRKKDRTSTGRTFSWDELLEKYKNKCYLTGREINLEQSSEYSLDHIIPRSSGGTNDFENCGLACRQANQAKSDMSLEEFQQLCLDVVNHFNLK